MVLADSATRAELRRAFGLAEVPDPAVGGVARFGDRLRRRVEGKGRAARD
jgi:hypothetical protein